MSARHLNFRHLRYFAEVARRGSVVTAARTLHVAPQTVSAQVQELEAAGGELNSAAVLQIRTRGFTIY